MKLDDDLCLCFHITRRKVENFVRIEQPRVASQISECGGAGTGCGWCVPFLEKIFRRGPEPLAELDDLTADDYAGQRQLYVKAGKGTPPPGSEPKE